MDNCRTIFHVNLWLKVDVALININLYRLIHSSNSNLGGDISTPLITALDLDPLLKWDRQPRPLCSNKLIVINLRYVWRPKGFCMERCILDVFIKWDLGFKRFLSFMYWRQKCCFTNFFALFDTRFKQNLVFAWIPNLSPTRVCKVEVLGFHTVVIT